MKRTIIFLIMTLICGEIFAQPSFNEDTLVQSLNWKNDLQEAEMSEDKVLYLDLSMTDLATIPGAVYKFSELKYLDLSFNKIQNITSDIIVLEKLEILDLSGNTFTSLPNEMASMSNLIELRLKDHTLKDDEVEKLNNLLPGCLIVLQ